MESGNRFSVVVVWKGGAGERSAAAWADTMNAPKSMHRNISIVVVIVHHRGRIPMEKAMVIIFYFVTLLAYYLSCLSHPKCHIMRPQQPACRKIHRDGKEWDGYAVLVMYTREE